MTAIQGRRHNLQLMTALALLACFLHDSPAHLIRHGQPNQAEARARA